MRNYATIKEELQRKSFFFMTGFFPVAHAQDFNLQQSVASADWRLISWVSARYLLVIALLVVGLKGAKAGYDWYHWEGSAAKAVESKEKLSKMFMYACILFFLLAMYRAFIPDYSALAV